jgi:hypothetical protein
MAEGAWLQALATLRALRRLGFAEEDQADTERALIVLVGSSDRARGLRCRDELSAVRRALSGCVR